MKTPKVPGTYDDPGEWFVLTLDASRVAVVLAGLQALLKYESDQMKMPEITLTKQMISDMETELSKTRKDD